MFESISTAVSGLQQFQQRIDVIGNNIANVNTVGYKDARITSSDSFSQTLDNALQVGTGVNTENVSSIFTQGAMTQTGAPTDLAIDGQGFFTVRDTSTGAIYATRDGSFKVDPTGYLLTSTNLRVQGFNDSTLGARGDIKIDATGAPAGTAAGATVTSFLMDAQGQVRVTLSDGTSFTRGQVLLQNFSSPQALAKEGNNLYSNLTAAGPLSQTLAPGTNGLGGIQVGSLETSNVDLTAEFSNLIIAQRGFQANSRVVTTSDEVLQEIINLKR